MKLHTIAPAPNSKTDAKRLGRGIGSGLGKTSGKGHKGQWARSGGGQNQDDEYLVHHSVLPATRASEISPPTWFSNGTERLSPIT